jgi:hypothetical protein
MNRDLGCRANLAALPAGASDWMEVRLGPTDQPYGYAYVGVFAQPPLRSTAGQTYAYYDATHDRIYASSYTLEFNAPLPTHLALVQRLGDFGTNIVAGVHAEGDVKLFGGLLSFRRDEKDLRMEISGMKDGLVRVLRRARYWLPLPFGFRTTGRVDLLFYRDFVEGTALVKIKIPPRLVLANGELKTYFDFLALSGARVLTEGMSPSDPVDGYMSPADYTLEGHPTRWAALLLPDGRAILFVLRFEGALQSLEQHLLFTDGAGALQLQGSAPLFGFRFSRVDRLTAGTHRISVFAMILENGNAATVQQAVSFFTAPPEVAVSSMQTEWLPIEKQSLPLFSARDW